MSCDFPELPVQIVTSRGSTRTLRFFCDTGSDHMVMPTYVARHEGIFYREEYAGTLSSSVGGSVRCYYLAEFEVVRCRPRVPPFLLGIRRAWLCQ